MRAGTLILAAALVLAGCTQDFDSFKKLVTPWTWSLGQVAFFCTSATAIWLFYERVKKKRKEVAEHKIKEAEEHARAEADRVEKHRLATELQITNLRAEIEAKRAAEAFSAAQKDRDAKLDKVIKLIGENGGSDLFKILERQDGMMLATHDMVGGLIAHQEIGFVTTDEDGGIREANAQFCRLAGCLESEVMDRGWVNAIHPDDRDRVVGEWAAAVKDRRLYRGAYRYQHANDDVIYVRCTAKPRHDKHGKYCGYAAFVEATGE